MNIYRVRVRKFIKYRMRFVKRIQLFIKKNMKRISKFTKGFSKGEKLIWNWLRQHTIEFEFQKRFSDCKDKLPLPIDFYLPKYNLCIEYQGSQHYDPGFYIRKKKSYEEGMKKYNTQKAHDEMKKAYCIQMSIDFLEIKYTENIENCLEKALLW